MATSVITRSLSIPSFSYPSVAMAIGTQVVALGLPKLVRMYLDFSQKNKTDANLIKLFSRIDVDDKPILDKNSSQSNQAEQIRTWMKMSNKLEGVTSLNLEELELTSIPPEISLFANLRILRLDHNKIKNENLKGINFPASLKCFFLYDNQFATTPLISNLSESCIVFHDMDLEDAESCLSDKDFAIRNVWKVSHEERWSNGEPRYIVDKSTNRCYLNQSLNNIRLKCCALTFGTPIVHSLAFVFKTLRLVSGYYFWSKKEKGFFDFSTRKFVKSNWQTRDDFEERLGQSVKEFSSIISIPFSIIGLQFSAIYGIFKPYDGRKLYASIEKAVYDGGCLAPCFQPSPHRHFFGGDIDKKDSW